MIYFAQFIKKNVATSMLVGTELSAPHPLIVENAHLCVACSSSFGGLDVLKALGNVSPHNKTHPEEEVLLWVLSGMPSLSGSECAHPKPRPV